MHVVVYCQTCTKRMHVCKCASPVWAHRQESTGSTVGSVIGWTVLVCCGIPALLVSALVVLGLLAGALG